MDPKAVGFLGIFRIEITAEMTKYLANIMKNSTKLTLSTMAGAGLLTSPLALDLTRDRYHFRGNNSHLCWMIVAMRSWMESLVALSYFGFARVHFGSD